MFGFDAVLSTGLIIVVVASVYLLVSSLIKISSGKDQDVKNKGKENLLYSFVGFLFFFCFYVVSLLPEHIG